MNDKNEMRLEQCRIVERNNTWTVICAALCVSSLAFATGSLHSLWGLLILANISWVDSKKDAD